MSKVSKLDFFHVSSKSNNVPSLQSHFFHPWSRHLRNFNESFLLQTQLSRQGLPWSTIMSLHTWQQIIKNFIGSCRTLLLQNYCATSTFNFSIHCINAKLMHTCKFVNLLTITHLIAWQFIGQRHVIIINILSPKNVMISLGKRDALSDNFNVSIYWPWIINRIYPNFVNDFSWPVQTIHVCW